MAKQKRNPIIYLLVNHMRTMRTINVSIWWIAPFGHWISESLNARNRCSLSTVSSDCQRLFVHSNHFNRFWRLVELLQNNKTFENFFFNLIELRKPFCERIVRYLKPNEWQMLLKWKQVFSHKWNVLLWIKNMEPNDDSICIRLPNGGS